MTFKMVGAAGFEPTTPTPPAWCATRLRYAPNQKTIDRRQPLINDEFALGIFPKQYAW